MDDEEVEQRPGINWVQVVAGALAAVSSAVLLSTLGVAGTVIGAALGSVIASVASAWYSRGLDASRQQVAAQAAALRRVTAARSSLDDAVSAMDRGESGAEAGVLQADRALGEAEEALEQAAHLAEGDSRQEPDTASDVVEPVPHDPVYGAEAGRRLPWKRVALIAAALFVAVMVAITVFELVTGRAVSTYTGGSDKGTGSTVPGVQDAPAEDTEERPTDEQTGSPEDPEEPDEPGETEEPAEPTPEPTTTTDPSTEPTPLPTPSETVLPSDPVTSEPAPTAGSTG